VAVGRIIEAAAGRTIQVAAKNAGNAKKWGGFSGTRPIKLAMGKKKKPTPGGAWASG
jgi:hypothetical protein